MDAEEGRRCGAVGTSSTPDSPDPDPVDDMVTYAAATIDQWRNRPDVMRAPLFCQGCGHEHGPIRRYLLKPPAKLRCDDCGTELSNWVRVTPLTIYVTTLAGAEYTLEVGVQVPTMVLQQRVACLIAAEGRSSGGPRLPTRRAWGRIRLVHGVNVLAPETLVGSWCGSARWVHVTAVLEPCKSKDCSGAPTLSRHWWPGSPHRAWSTVSIRHERSAPEPAPRRNPEHVRTRITFSCPLTNQNFEGALYDFGSVIEVDSGLALLVDLTEGSFEYQQCFPLALAGMDLMAEPGWRLSQHFRAPTRVEVQDRALEIRKQFASAAYEKEIDMLNPQYLHGCAKDQREALSRHLNDHLHPHQTKDSRCLGLLSAAFNRHYTFYVLHADAESGLRMDRYQGAKAQDTLEVAVYIVEGHAWTYVPDAVGTLGALFSHWENDANVCRTFTCPTSANGEASTQRDILEDSDADTCTAGTLVSDDPLVNATFHKMRRLYMTMRRHLHAFGLDLGIQHPSDRLLLNGYVSSGDLKEELQLGFVTLLRTLEHHRTCSDQVRAGAPLPPRCDLHFYEAETEEIRLQLIALGFLETIGENGEGGEAVPTPMAPVQAQAGAGAWQGRKAGILQARRPLHQSCSESTREDGTATATGSGRT